MTDRDTIAAAEADRDPAEPKPAPAWMTNPNPADLAAGLVEFGKAMGVAAAAMKQQQEQIGALVRRVDVVERRGQMRSVPMTGTALVPETDETRAAVARLSSIADTQQRTLDAMASQHGELIEAMTAMARRLAALEAPRKVRRALGR